MTTLDRAPTSRTSLLSEAVDLLEELAARRVDPPAARAAVERLGDGYPGVRIELLWDVEPFDGSIQYDLLVRDDRGVTTSLSVSGPDDGLPWPLRGAQRVGDSVLVDVDGERLSIGEAVAYLDSLGDELGVDIAGRLVDACLARAMVAPAVEAMAPPTLAAAVAAYRRAHDLVDADAFARWQRTRALSDDDVARMAGAATVLAGVRRDGVDGEPFATWRERRRHEAVIRWFWSIGSARRPEGSSPP